MSTRHVGYAMDLLPKGGTFAVGLVSTEWLDELERFGSLASRQCMICSGYVLASGTDHAAAVRNLSGELSAHRHPLAERAVSCFLCSGPTDEERYCRACDVFSETRPALCSEVSA